MVLNASAPGNVAAPIHLPAWQKAFFSVFSGNGDRGGKAHFQAAFIFPRDKKFYGIALGKPPTFNSQYLTVDKERLKAIP